MRTILLFLGLFILSGMGFSQLRKWEVWSSMSVGVGFDFNYQEKEFLTKHELQGGAIFDIAIGKQQMLGFEFNVGNRIIKINDLQEHFSLNSPEHSKLIDFTEGYHVLYDIGLRYAPVLFLNKRKFYNQLFFKPAFAFGLNKTSQMEHSLSFYPTDTTEFVRKQFGTRIDSNGNKNWGWYGSASLSIGYETIDNFSFFLTTKFDFGKSNSSIEYYELIDNSIETNTPHNLTVKRKAIHMRIGMLFHYNR